MLTKVVRRKRDANTQHPLAADVIPLDERGPIHDFIFQLYHGPLGYSFRRYTPSLEFFAIMGGIYYNFGLTFSSWLSMFGGLVLPYVRNQLPEDRRKRPYTLQVFLEGLWGTSRPNVLYFITSFSPKAAKWMYSKAHHSWQAGSSSLQVLFTTCCALLIAACIKRWLAWQRHIHEGECFKYPKHPLGSTESRIEIRLLKIHRWMPFAGVRTTLVTASISTTPPYEAISYTWGNPTESQTIIVNGRPFKTTAATYNTLYGCSLWWRSRLVWIDYVCIKQSDYKDKSMQVALMKEIYSNASKVIVWLARPTKAEGLQRYIELLGRLRDERVAIDMIHELSDHITYYGLSTEDLSRIIERERDSHCVYRLAALSDFLANPWFTRVWIVQEVAVAREISFLYENQHLDWNSLLNVMGSFQEPEMAAALAAGGRNGDLRNTQNFLALARLQTDTNTLKERRSKHYWGMVGLGDYLSPTLLPLSLLLAKCADFEATDPRDKVYAVLGLASDDSPRFIRPDYENKTTREVYIDTARYVLQTRAPLALLPFAGIGGRTSASVPDLPSWVPDWTSPRRPCALDQPLHNHYEKTQYYASLTTKPEVNLDPTSNVLTLGGAIVDEIKALSTICHFERPDSISLAESYGSGSHARQAAFIVNWHDDAFMLALCGSILRHRSSIEEAFWRTLIGDMMPSSRPAPAVLAGDYRNWIACWRLVHQFCRLKGKGNPLPPGLSPASPTFAIWGTAMGLCAVRWKFCVTRRGYLGMVPQGSRPGDLVAIILGAKTPYVLRCCGRVKDSFELVGECYMDGMMDGEMVGMLPRMERLKIV